MVLQIRPGICECNIAFLLDFNACESISELHGDDDEEVWHFIFKLRKILSIPKTLHRQRCRSPDFPQAILHGGMC